MSRLIVRLHEQLDADRYHRYGAVLHDSGETRAVVRRLVTGKGGDNVIEIQVDRRDRAALLFLEQNPAGGRGYS